MRPNDVLKKQAHVLIARNRGRPVFRVLYRAARSYIRGYENINYDLHTNGEEEVLRRLAGFVDRPVVFDVGANVGEWTRTAKRWMPGAQIHCFEIVPDTFAILRCSTGSLSGVRLNPLGLGAAEGEVRVELCEGDSSRASVVALPEASGHRQVVTGRIIPGDEYCRRAGIERVHMLKIDTEGYDFDVLRGFADMLSAGSIDVVQFEYGLWSIWTKHSLADHYEMLSGHGYRLGKIFPRGVEFRDYVASIDEDLRGPNYLAVRADRDELLDLLAHQ